MAFFIALSTQLMILKIYSTDTNQPPVFSIGVKLLFFLPSKTHKMYKRRHSISSCDKLGALVHTHTRTHTGKARALSWGLMSPFACVCRLIKNLIKVSTQWHVFNMMGRKVLLHSALTGYVHTYIRDVFVRCNA